MKQALSILLVFLPALYAGKLPTVGSHPWFKTYNGFAYRKVDMMIATDGTFLIYPKIDEKRVSAANKIVTKVVVEYQAKGSDKWVTRKVDANGFEVADTAAAPRKNAEIIGTVTGEVQFRLKVEHDKKGVNLMAEFVKMPDYTKAKYRLKLVSQLPDLYKISAAEKKAEVSAKTRSDAMTIVPVHSRLAKKQRFKLHGEVDLQPYQQAGIQSVQLKTKKYSKNDVYWSLLDQKKGTLVVEFKNEKAGAHKGFYISTVLVDQTGEQRSKGLRIEVK